MNIDATETDLHATTEALKLAAILDDRAPKADKARVVAWAEKIHTHRLTRDDLLDGLQAFYDSPSERAIQIGDLVHHARIAKRARLDKEEDAERERRRADLDVKADDTDIRDVLADAITGRIEKKTDRLTAAREALQTCHGKRECQPAIKEYIAALCEAPKAPGKPKRKAKAKT